MPVTTDQPAPYAPATAILELIQRHRNKGLPAVVDSDVLARAGVSDSLIPRTLQALKTLDLLDGDGRPTDIFEGIRLAPTSEYQKRLSEWLSGAYADALTYIDPAVDDEIAIRDAFRKYVPTGQQARMVSLFMGLFTAAGVMPVRQKQPVPRTSTSLAVPKARLPLRKPIAVPAQSMRQNAAARTMANSPSGSSLPPALAGLLASLPASGRWTQVQRDKFMTAFPVMLDFVFEIVPEAELSDINKENGD